MSVTIQIDDQVLQVEKGITILQAARLHQIEIPTLCDFPGLPSHGSCRMCVVEITGRPNMPTSCTTPVEDGMSIYTHSPKVLALRKELLQMLLSEHPSGCLFCPEKAHCDECMVTLRKAAVTTGCGSCPKDHQCELQSLAEKYEVDSPEYPIRYRMLPVEKSDPFFDRDYNLCILCGRCIRVCGETHFTNTLAYTRRGTHAVVGTAFYRTHLESSCTFCGMCVEVCPTGALSEKTRKWDGKPDRETASTCPLCSAGCQMNLLSRKERVIGSLPNHGAGEDALCVKGRFGITELVNHPSRLKQPLKRVDETWMATGWKEAVETAAEKLSACSPERFKMLVSAGSTNEDLYVAARFTREVMKSANISVGAGREYAPVVEPLARILRQSKPLEALCDASLILTIGVEDKYAQSVIEVKLRQAKALGARIVALGGRALAWGRHADEWLKTGAGQEAALLSELTRLAGGNSSADGGDARVVRAAGLLRQYGSPVVVLGPLALKNPEILCAVEVMVETYGAQVVALPEQANLAGALRLGLLDGGDHPDGQDVDVFYLVGEMAPAGVTGKPFIVYQNIYPPLDSRTADLMLPATAFTEEEGSFTDSAGRLREIHPAVRRPGEALPTWEILCRIATAMGAPGFEYDSVESIRKEMAVSAIPWLGQEGAISPSTTKAPPVEPGRHVYMGYPLAHWVEGLRSLYPEPTNGRNE